MGINISEAAREWNISRGTIYRKCKTGEMSRMQDGTIDPAEMVRVFGQPKKKKTPKKRTKKEQHLNTVQNTEIEHSYTLEKQLLEQQLKFEQERRAELEKQLEKIERQLEQSETQKMELLKSVTDLSSTIKRLEAPKEKKGIFGFFRK